MFDKLSACKRILLHVFWIQPSLLFNVTSMVNHTSATENVTRCHLQDFNFNFIAPESSPVNHLDAVYEVQVLTCLLNAIVAVVATLTNGCIVIAIVRTPSLHSPSNFLLGCLSLTDFLTGLVVQPAVVVTSVLMARSRDDKANIEIHLNNACTAFTFYLFVTTILSSMTVFSLTAISVDRYLALRLHLRYKELVTVKRVAIVEAVFLCGSIAVTVTLMFNQTVAVLTLGVIGLGICIPASFSAQMRVFIIVRQHERKVAENIELKSRLQDQQVTVTEIAKVKKNSRTVLLVWAVLFVCVGPLLGASFAFAVKGFTVDVNKALNISVTIMYINSSINPFLYGTRISGIRQAVLRLLRRSGNENQTP